MELTYYIGDIWRIMSKARNAEEKQRVRKKHCNGDIFWFALLFEI